MKKIIYIIGLILMINFCCENAYAEGLTQFASSTKGTCTVNSGLSSSNMCIYDCSVDGTTKDLYGKEINGHYKFQYVVELKEENGYLILIDGQVIEVDGDGKAFPYYGPVNELLTDIGQIASTAEEIAGLDKIVSFIAGVNKLDLIRRVNFGGQETYFYLGADLTDNRPSKEYFVNDDNTLSCKPIIPIVVPTTVGDDNIATEIPDSLVNKMANYIAEHLGPDLMKKIDPSYNPNTGYNIDIESSPLVKNKISIIRGKQEPSTNPDTTEKNVCGLLGGEESKTVQFLKKIYNYLKMGIPVLIIVFSIFDFIKIACTGNEDDTKKAISKFAKRMIFAIVFVIVPILISFIINISGLASQYPSLNGGLKAIFCILG